MQSEITAIIVEDIKDFHHVIETFVAEVAPNVRIVGNAFTLMEAEVLIKKHLPDFLFLDIQFEAEGKTAFDLLRKMSNSGDYNFQVIITTAHNEQKYYAEAFNLGAIHFLMKPIDKQKLKEAIVRVQKNRPENHITKVLEQVVQVHDQLHSEKLIDRIVIEGLNYTEIVQLKDIVYLEASGRYTYIFLNSVGFNPICSTKNLGEFEKKLLSNPDFFRIHRNKILNLNYVQRIFKKDYSFVLFSPFEKQFASKDRFKEFLKYIDIKESNN
jgi:two-component system LytT family response regulator